MSEGVRVRFAPSPTGPLHVGGLRAALYNYLHAKKNNGTFILRVEDTDQKREVSGSYEYIEESLRWCGLTPDESPSKGGGFGPYKQSQRKSVYKKHIEVLVEKGAAYYAFDKAEDLDMHRKDHEKKGKTFIYNAHNRLKLVNSLSLDKKKVEKLLKTVPYVVRFKMPDNEMVVFEDEIRGKIEVSSRELDDKVLYKSDKMPTYHFANVVDDHMMKITHVIRGDDHMINSFKQRQIYEAMGWEVPNFAHIPLIHSEQGKKLSKRDNASTLEDYIKIGVISDALRNYLLRLGWSYKDKEIFTKQESIDLFDLSGVGKSPSKLDMNRIYSINETYIKSIDQKDLFNFFKEYVSKYKKPLNQSKESILLKSMGFLKNKAKTLEDIWNNAQYIIKDKIEISSDDKKLIDDFSKKIINEFINEYENLSSLSRETLEPLIKSLIDKHKTNFKGVGQPLRIALVGSRFGPGLYDVILSLDKAEVLKRLKQI